MELVRHRLIMEPVELNAHMQVRVLPAMSLKYILWCLSPSGKASGCDSDMRGFDPHQTPQQFLCQRDWVVREVLYTF